MSTNEIPYPEVGLVSGKNDTFATQKVGSEGAELFYPCWIALALENRPGSSVTLTQLYNQVNSKRVPVPPGLAPLHSPTSLMQYVVDEPSKSSRPACLRGLKFVGQHIQDVVLNDLKFSDICTLWHTVGMDFTRWALTTVDNARLGQQTSEPGPPSHNGQGTSSARIDEYDTLREIGDRTTPSTSAASLDQKYKPAPDSAFTVSHLGALPFPEISVRRSLEIPGQQLAVSTTVPSSYNGNAVAGPGPNSAANSPAQGASDKLKLKKKVYYMNQKVGIEGSHLVAGEWLKAVVSHTDNHQCRHFTKVSSVYQVYRAYPYHPPRCPILDEPSFLKLLDRTLEGLDDPDSQPIRTTSLKAESGRTAASASNDMGFSYKVIRGTLCEPDKMRRKDHEMIWEAVGFNWKKAQPFNWTEAGICQARMKSLEAKQAKQVKIEHRDDFYENPRPPVGSVGKSVAPDFVATWLARTYRPAPLHRCISQKKVWHDFQELVHYERNLCARNLQILSQNPRLDPVEILRIERDRLSRQYELSGAYLELRPGEVFHRMEVMFKCQVGQNAKGEYALNGLEEVGHPPMHPMMQLDSIR